MVERPGGATDGGVHALSVPRAADPRRVLQPPGPGDEVPQQRLRDVLRQGHGRRGPADRRGDGGLREQQGDEPFRDHQPGGRRLCSICPGQAAPASITVQTDAPVRYIGADKKHGPPRQPMAAEWMWWSPEMQLPGRRAAVAGARAVVRGAGLRGGVDDHGPPGNGKTLLVYAIAEEPRPADPRARPVGDDVARLRVGMETSQLERAGDRARGGLRLDDRKAGRTSARRSTGRLRDDPELHRRGAPDRRHPVRDDDQRPEGGRPGAVLHGEGEARRGVAAGPHRHPSRDRQSPREGRLAVAMRVLQDLEAAERVADQTEGRSIAQVQEICYRMAVEK